MISGAQGLVSITCIEFACILTGTTLANEVSVAYIDWHNACVLKSFELILTGTTLAYWSLSSLYWLVRILCFEVLWAYNEWHNAYVWKSLIGTTPVLRSAKRAPANVRRLNNRKWRQRYCSAGERSRALALLNAALMSFETILTGCFRRRKHTTLKIAPIRFYSTLSIHVVECILMSQIFWIDYYNSTRTITTALTSWTLGRQGGFEI